MLAILQFDEEFRGMVERGEATYDNHSSLNELQAHHIDSSAVKSSNSRPRDRGRPRASKLRTGSSKSFNRHCYKRNEDSINSAGYIYTQACIVYFTRCCVSSFSTFSWKKKRPSSNWPYSSPTTAFLTVTLHHARICFVLIRICKIYVLSHAISTLGAAKWPLSPATKISLSPILHIAFILSKTCLFYQRTLLMVEAPKIPQ